MPTFLTFPSGLGGSSSAGKSIKIGNVKTIQVDSAIKANVTATISSETDTDRVYDFTFTIPQGNDGYSPTVEIFHQTVVWRINEDKAPMAFFETDNTKPTEFDLTKCKFIPQADIVDTNVGLELHHYPFTLFDIVQGVLRHEYGILSDREPVYKRPVNLFKVAEKVMKLHYQGVIGLIPLSLTAHELAHNGDIFIPLTDEYVLNDTTVYLDVSKN